MRVLTPEFAQRFIQKTVKNFPHNVNIMDHRGVIIASKDISRIGDFHEVAHGLLSGTMETGVVKDSNRFIGTKPGINMFIDYKGEHVGVICVTGDPDTVQSFASFVKNSMETMLEYENIMAHEHRHRSKDQQFLHYLLFEDEFSIEEANRLATELNIQPNSTGAIIIFRITPKIDPATMLRNLNVNTPLVSHHIAIMDRNNHIILLNFLDTSVDEAVRKYKDIFDSQFQNLQQKLGLPEEDDNMSIFVGSLQSQVDKMRISYQHAQQLLLQSKEPRGIQFFYDHILDYIRESVSARLYFDIFSIFQNLFKGDEKRVMIETINMLAEHNYNIAKTSQVLHVHRNTLIFRLNKLKDALNIDPLASGADREFLNELACYMRKT